MADTNGQDGGNVSGRFRDLERITEALARANRELLAAQVLMHDRQNQFDVNLNRLIEQQAHTDKQIAALTEAQKAQGERVDKLVSAIGELIQRMPPLRP